MRTAKIYNIQTSLSADRHCGWLISFYLLFYFYFCFRFLCKLKEPELIEPLMPAIRACLEHRHSYVRRNAVLAIYTIYRKFVFIPL